MSGLLVMANNGRPGMNSQSQNNRATLTYDFEDGTAGDWTQIDADGDGFSWALHAPDETYTSDVGHNGSDYYVFSESYDNDNGVALTPDNYLVSPQLRLGGSITFYAQAQDPDWASEHFGVAVSTTNGYSADAFTTIAEWTMTAKRTGATGIHKTRSGNRTTAEWYEYTVNLSAYSGMGYVAIRHFNCTDMFILNVDDITIVEGEAGGVTPTDTYTITATANPTAGGYLTMENVLLFSDDFENGIANWTTIDADGDGNTWYDLIDNNPNGILGHEGSWGFATSASYNGSVLTPDNYLVSPQLPLKGTFSFWACAQDNQWAGEHFGVAVSTTSATNASAFTTIQEWTLTAKSGSGVYSRDTRDGQTREQGVWYQYTVDLSSYNGQTGYIAIRHFNCTDMFRMNVDDVELRANNVGTTVTGTFAAGETCSVTATPNSGYSFINWTENGSTLSGNTTYSFAVNSNRTLNANFQQQQSQTWTITATPDPEEGGYVTIGYRDRATLTYDFETGTTEGWTTIDADGDGYNWDCHVNTGSGNHATHSGDAVMVSGSYDNDLGTPLTPDNYLVSPQITLGGSITFYACAQDESWPSEHFGVAVSTTNNTNASAFTTIQEWTLTSKAGGAPTDFTRSGGTRSGAWYEYTVDLSAYSGTGYVAIRHFNCTDMFYINVDDITIVEGNGGGQTGGTVSAVFEDGQTCVMSAFPYTGYYFVNWTENGTSFTTEANPYTFEVHGNRNFVAHFSPEAPDNYTVNVSANPTNGGTVTGGGAFAAGQNCTVVAIADDCYAFVNWTENGTVVSTNPNYTFAVNANHNLVANFEFQTYNVTVSANPTEGGTVAINGRNRDVIFSDDFENGIANWTTIDADGDGYTWYDLIDNNPNNIPGHNGSAGFATSASYQSVALTPDNYLVSPQVALNGTFSFWACGQDASWAAEHFGVAVSTTNSTSASAFTTIQEWTLSAKSGSDVFTRDTRDGQYRDQGAWYQFSVDLSSYNGQMGYIAIRHFDVTDMFRINVDDVELTANGGGQGGGTSIIYDFEDQTTQGWTNIDADGDGFVWVLGSQIGGVYLVADGDLTGSGHNASVDLMCSGSYRNTSSSSGVALNPDNYLVSPQIQLGGSINFWACGQDADWAAEHFGVAVSTTNNTSASAFTTIQEWTLTAKGSGVPTRYTRDGNLRDQGAWYQFTVDLSAYSGTGYVAIRHFNCTDQFILNIDDITIVEGNGGSQGGDGNFDCGESCTVTATANTGYTFVNWTENGTVVSSNNVYTFTVDADRDLVANFVPQGTQTYTITVSANPTEGGEVEGGGTVAQGQSCTVVATPSEPCYAFVNWTENGTVVSTNASYTINNVTANHTLVANFEFQTYTITATPDPVEGGTVAIARGRDELFYDFETGTLEGWTTIDADGDGHNWEMGSILMAGYSIPSHNEGEDCVTSQSYDGDAGVALTPDNYLVSPQVTLGGSVTFWACAQDPDWASEHFGLAVSTTNNTDAAAFTTIQEWTMTAKGAGQTGNYMSRSREGREGTWYEYTVDLSAYAGETGYVAIRHFNCTDMFYLNVDDITIVEGSNGGGGEVGESVTADFDCGETCTLTATPNPNYEFVAWTEDGVEVSTNAVYTFTVEGNRNLVAHFEYNDGVAENSLEIALYPNPVNDLLNVVASESINNLEVYTITGALVYSQKNCSNKVEINTSAFSTGAYLIRMTTQSTTEVRRFVKF